MCLWRNSLWAGAWALGVVLWVPSRSSDERFKNYRDAWSYDTRGTRTQLCSSQRCCLFARDGNEQECSTTTTSTTRETHTHNSTTFHTRTTPYAISLVMDVMARSSLPFAGLRQRNITHVLCLDLAHIHITRMYQRRRTKNKDLTLSPIPSPAYV